MDFIVVRRDRVEFGLACLCVKAIETLFGIKIGERFCGLVRGFFEKLIEERKRGLSRTSIEILKPMLLLGKSYGCGLGRVFDRDCQTYLLVDRQEGLTEELIVDSLFSR